jgi:RHS repeat-associated protein
MANRNGYTVTSSSANLPTNINGPGGVSAAFSYGPDRQRKQQVSVYTTDGDSGTETTIYVNGILEIESTPAQTHYKHIIQVPGGTQIIYDIQSISGTQTTYVTSDHLGSGNLLLNSAGSVEINESYSAYGYRRAANWSTPLSASSADFVTIASTTRRGYTEAFHELLDNVGLIHMNGRVFDPVIARFVSPDPKLGMSCRSQSWNPYSYVMNRPLTLTDPTGFTAVNTTNHPSQDPQDYSTGGGVDTSGSFPIGNLPGITVTSSRIQDVLATATPTSGGGGAGGAPGGGMDSGGGAAGPSTGGVPYPPKKGFPKDKYPKCSGCESAAAEGQAGCIKEYGRDLMTGVCLQWWLTWADTCSNACSPG